MYMKRALSLLQGDQTTLMSDDKNKSIDYNKCL